MTHSVTQLSGDGAWVRSQAGAAAERTLAVVLCSVRSRRRGASARMPASDAMAVPAKAEADEPWKLRAAKTAVALSKHTFDMSDATGHRFMDHSDGSNLVVAVRDDFSDQRLLNIFANYAIGAGCTVVAWDRKNNRFADLSKGGYRERRRTHSGMLITANRAGAGGKLRALLSIKTQSSVDNVLSRKFVHVVVDGGSGKMACCASRARGSSSGFFAGLSAALHLAGATSFVSIPPLPRQHPEQPPRPESPAPPNQVVVFNETVLDESTQERLNI